MSNNPKYIINGSFLCANLTGIERFSYELCIYLDKMTEKDEFGIFIPKNVKNIPRLEKIKIYKSKIKLKSYPRWNNFVYGTFLLKHGATGIDFSNTCSILKPGIVFIHDIYCKLYKNDFKTFKDKLVRLYSCFMYRFSANHAKMLFTVSEFSRHQIAENYNVPIESIHVIPNGWDHFKSTEPDFSILEKSPILSGAFYFTLGSLSKRKNLKWIAEYAAGHQDEFFAISGKPLETLVAPELARLHELKNVIFLGYLSDGQVKALMQKCRAFLFPSYYEGFGIPPLEALSVGAQIVVSKSSCLPEIYGDSAHYIDPDNSSISLEKLLSEPVGSAEEILSKYTYGNAAAAFLSLLRR